MPLIQSCFCCYLVFLLHNINVFSCIENWSECFVTACSSLSASTENGRGAECMRIALKKSLVFYFQISALYLISFYTEIQRQSDISIRQNYPLQAMHSRLCIFVDIFIGENSKCINIFVSLLYFIWVLNGSVLPPCRIQHGSNRALINAFFPSEAIYLFYLWLLGIVCSTLRIWNI